MLTVSAWAKNGAIVAAVDKAAVDMGDSIQFTLTLHGETAGTELSPVKFPEGFLVAGRTQSTNISFESGAMQKATELIYVLVPQRPGTFTLGPFTVKRSGKQFSTAPIEVTVKKPAVPRHLDPGPGGRYTL